MNHRNTICGLILFSALALRSEIASAQAKNYQPFRVDSGISGTYASAFGRGGFGAVVEPKFLVHDRIGVGARLEGAVMFGGSIDTGDGSDSNVSMDVAAAAAFLAKGEYLFTDGTLRPFASLGLGFYSIGAQSVDAGGGAANINQKAGRYFGVAPSLGVDLGRVRLAATYNAILGADVEVQQTVGTMQQTASFSQSYMTFELSFRWGGARKSPGGV